MSVEAAATKESCYNKIRQSIKLNAKIQKLIKNKKKKQLKIIKPTYYFTFL